MKSERRPRAGKRSVAPASALPADYADLIRRIKARVATAQTRAALAASRELLRLYWTIGRDLVGDAGRNDYGKRAIERLAADLAAAFPGVQGLSARNLWRMRAFYLAYPPQPLLQQPAAGSRAPILPPPVAESADPELPAAVPPVPWAHQVLLLERVKDAGERAVYAKLAMEQGWSRTTLAQQIATGLGKRRGKAVTNFARTLPPPQSALATESLKDPYVFDFLTLANDAREREVETELIAHVQQFLLELGVGFAFVGRQVRVEVDGDDYFVDLLLYHLKLRCFVVVELKAGAFRPEYAGKMNFYLSAVDAQLRHAQDMPSIGLLLCRSKKRLVVEYALRDIRKPIGVAEWQTRLVASLPKELEGSLPTVEEIEQELGR